MVVSPDSATNITAGKSEELNKDLIKQLTDFNMSGKSL